MGRKKVVAVAASDATGRVAGRSRTNGRLMRRSSRRAPSSMVRSLRGRRRPARCGRNTSPRETARSNSRPSASRISSPGKLPRPVADRTVRRIPLASGALRIAGFAASLRGSWRCCRRGPAGARSGAPPCGAGTYLPDVRRAVREQLGGSSDMRRVQGEHPPARRRLLPGRLISRRRDPAAGRRRGSGGARWQAPVFGPGCSARGRVSRGTG